MLGKAAGDFGSKQTKVVEIMETIIKENPELEKQLQKRGFLSTTLALCAYIFENWMTSNILYTKVKVI